MRERAQENQRGNRARIRRHGAHRPHWRRIEVWVVIGGLLTVVFLNHLDLVRESRGTAAVAGDTLAALRNEFPNPFAVNGLYESWGGGSAALILLLHLAGTLLAGFFLLRLTGHRIAALAGAALYGVHPLHVAMFAQGAEVGLVLAPLAFFGAGLLAYGPRGVRAAGALLAGIGVLLDPTLLMLPVFLVLLRVFAPGTAPPRGAVRLTALCSLAGAAVALLAGWRTWPREILTDAWLPPGPPLENPVTNLLLTLGRAVGHVFSPAFSGVDYGRGEVPSAWITSDVGAVWLLGFGALTTVLVLAARPNAAPELRRPRIGLAAAAGVATLLLPLPTLLALLHTERGFFAGALLVVSFLPGLMLALGVGAVLDARRGPRGLRRLLAGALALVVVVPASTATFRDATRLKSPAAALKAARHVSKRSYPLQRDYLAWLLRRSHNKLDLQKRYVAFTAAHPYDDRAWDAFGRFDWAIRRFPDAVTAWTRALALAPENDAYRYYLAAAQLMARRYGAAIETARTLPAEVPEVEALRRLALARAGRPESFDPADAARAAPVVLRAQGMILTEAGRYREALVLLDRARAARPGDALIAAYRGWCLLRLGQVDDAEDTLLLDALVDESGWLAHRILGDLYLAEGPRHNRREAYHHYAYFVQYDRGHPELPAILKILEQMQKGER